MSFQLPARFTAPNKVNKSRHQCFMLTLARLMESDDFLMQGRTALFLDGQERPNFIQSGPVLLALSDTYINTATDKHSSSRHTLGLFTLEYLQVAPEGRGKGQASKALRIVLKAADKWDIYLRLLPLAHDLSDMSDAELTEWYGRYGFTEPDGKYLVRAPKQPLPEPRPKAPTAPAPTCGEMERAIATQLLTSVLRFGYTVTVNNGGDDNELEYSADLPVILAAMFAAGEDELYFYAAGATSSDGYAGWAHLVYGNSGWDVLCDYSTALEPLLKDTNALIDRYEQLTEV